MAHGTRDENRRADGQRPVNPVLPADALCPSGPENGPAEREFGRARDFLCCSGKAVSSRAARVLWRVETGIDSTLLGCSFGRDHGSEKLCHGQTRAPRSGRPLQAPDNFDYSSVDNLLRLKPKISGR